MERGVWREVCGERCRERGCREIYPEKEEKGNDRECGRKNEKNEDRGRDGRRDNESRIQI